MSAASRVSIAVALSVFAVLLLLAEALLRIGLGLGDPPLYVLDSTISYYPKPSTSYRRFGNEITYNSLAMRARERANDEPCELRVLVLGDSVVNGGVQTDQKELATARLEQRLTTELQRPVWIGNGSAGGWAPENIKAYVAKFGWQSPVAIVFVLNSHDVAQRAVFAADLGPNFPTQRPWLALGELISRYLPRYISVPWLDAPTKEGLSNNSLDAVASGGVAILEGLITDARQIADTVVVVHNRERHEGGDLQKVLLAQTLSRLAAATGVQYIEFGRVQSDPRLPRSPYRDDIHLNAFGQGLLADAMREAVFDRLRAAVAAQPAECAIRQQELMPVRHLN